MQIYATLFKINEKCYFSVISWPILILFVLSDRAWCGLQIFYTELWNSLIMQIYAHLFKINEKCHLSSILKSQQICTCYLQVSPGTHCLVDVFYFDRKFDVVIWQFWSVVWPQIEGHLDLLWWTPISSNLCISNCWYCPYMFVCYTTGLSFRLDATCI